ncbi:hypothetical protein [Rhodanobacter lindaniclasticus]
MASSASRSCARWVPDVRHHHLLAQAAETALAVACNTDTARRGTPAPRGQLHREH